MLGSKLFDIPSYSRWFVWRIAFCVVQCNHTGLALRGRICGGLAYCCVVAGLARVYLCLNMRHDNCINYDLVLGYLVYATFKLRYACH